MGARDWGSEPRTCRGGNGQNGLNGPNGRKPRGAERGLIFLSIPSILSMVSIGGRRMGASQEIKGREGIEGNPASEVRGHAIWLLRRRGGLAGGGKAGSCRRSPKG